MALAFVLDEHLRGVLWRAIQSLNDQSDYRLDVVRVGDAPDLPLGIGDAELLLWAEAHNRILVTCDRATIATHLDHHIQAGHTSPGVILLRDVSVSELVEHLQLVAYATDAEEFRDRLCFVP